MYYLVSIVCYILSVAESNMSIYCDRIFAEAKDLFARWVVYSAKINNLQAVNEGGRIVTALES